MLRELKHNGVIIPEPPPHRAVSIRIRDKWVTLDAEQEEMAFAWCRKIGTPYVQDSVFIRNFIIDFSRALGEKRLALDEIDFTQVLEIIDAERRAKENMSKEERKALAAERKLKREALKEQYGYAVADGERIELANYIVEPGGIFMGRGKHPLRGRWKEGAKQADITLNLSPGSETPPGDWQRVWQPESLWVARWQDKLSGKMKYIWLHDTAPIKQKREALKFDQARKLRFRIDQVRSVIEQGLSADDPRRRKIATVCYLIDELCLRVGDEKDPEEADTVGATTLRPEHMKIHPDGTIEFRFLGKDSVLWHKKISSPPDPVRKNLEELARDARPSRNGSNKKLHPAHQKPQLFPDVSSRNVNEFLSQEVMPGLTAKVFRTFHATSVVEQKLDEEKVTADDPEYRKWGAAVRANLAAAIKCNHTKQPPKSWGERRKKFREREQRARERISKAKERLNKLNEDLARLRAEKRERMVKAKTSAQRTSLSARYRKRIGSKKDQIERVRLREQKAHMALGKIQEQKRIATSNRSWNLGTSQKSYIDPRVYYSWGLRVDYDVLECFYSATLRRKFMWVKNGELQ